LILAGVVSSTATAVYALRDKLRPIVHRLDQGRFRRFRLSVFSKANLKILYVTFQIVCSSSFTLDVKFPNVFSDYLEFLDVVTFDMFGTLNLGCMKLAIPTYLAYILISSLVPIALVAVVWAVYGLRLAFAKRLTRRQREDILSQHMGMMWTITYLVLPTVSQIQFRGLNCVRVSGKMYLRVDTSIECSTTGAYPMLLAFTLPLIFLYQSIPIVWAYLLYTNRERLNPPMEDKRRAYEKRAKDRRIADLRFLFADFRCEASAYEVYDIYRRIILLGVLPFIAEPSVRAGTGCFLAIIGCVLFREILPYYKFQTNILALAAQYQILITYAGAFVVLSETLFPYNHETLGAWLVAANLVCVVLMPYLGAADMRKQEANAARQRKLQNQLLVDKNEDKLKFQTTWRNLSEESPGAEDRALAGARALAQRYSEKPKQLNTFEDVDDLIAEAKAAEEPMHTAMRNLVEGVGGTYDQGPLKKKERCLEKMYADYGGDPRRVVDIVRASALFLTMAQLASAIETLLGDGCPLVVVRAKDRYNHPTSFGYMDMLLNVRLADSRHVGELQLHISSIHVIKASCHRTYAILRQVGWEDLELEGREDDGDDESGREEEDEEEDIFVGVLSGMREVSWARNWKAWSQDDQRAQGTNSSHTLEMTSTKTDTKIGHLNPLHGEAAAEEITTPTVTAHEHKSPTTAMDVSLSDRVNIVVQEEAGSNTDDVAGSGGGVGSKRMSGGENERSINTPASGSIVIGGHEWSTAAPSRRSSTFALPRVAVPPEAVASAAVGEPMKNLRRIQTAQVTTLRSALRENQMSDQL